MQTRVQKWGNSLGIRIPKALAERTGLASGSTVEFEMKDGLIVIRPKSQALDILLSRVTAKNIHGEISTGKKMGREIW